MGGLEWTAVDTKRQLAAKIPTTALGAPILAEGFRFKRMPPCFVTLDAPMRRQTST
jgi:hypothetical protein